MTAIAAPIDMEVIENAIHAWFYGSMDIEVIWQNQSAPRPEYPYGSLLIISGPTATSPMVETRHEYLPSQPSGEELEITACVPCQFVVSCQTYVSLEDSRNPNYNARSYLNKALGALGLPSYLASLCAAKVSVIDKNLMAGIDAVINDAFVSRAAMEITFGSPINAQEYATYIESVELRSSSLGIDMIVSI